MATNKKKILKMIHYSKLKFEKFSLCSDFFLLYCLSKLEQKIPNEIYFLSIRSSVKPSLMVCAMNSVIPFFSQKDT